MSRETISPFQGHLNVKIAVQIPTSRGEKRRLMCECLNVLTLNSFNVMMGLFTYGVRGGTNLELSARCMFSSNLVNIIYFRL